MLLLRARLLIATLWVGSLWTVGYLVAPVLFATLSDKELAGTIAGSMFQVEAWVSIFCAATLAALLSRVTEEADPPLRKIRLGLVFAMFACTALGYFAIQPYMAELRVVLHQAVVPSDAKMQFGILHGVASGIYLLESLLGAALILKLR